MSLPPSPTASLSQHVSAFEAGAHVVSAAFLGQTPTLALADGSVLFVGGGETHRVTVHPHAAILVACSDGARLATGSGDGRVVTIDEQGKTTDIADEQGAWIDAIALKPDGSAAWSAGKTVRARDPTGAVTSLAAPSSVRGLAFLRKGYRLAASHYNGVSLWFPNVETPPDLLDWKGSHIDVTVSPDGRFIVTSMQENALHGWTLADNRNMRMSGYPAKTRSMSWSHDGNWLATSGAQACIVWPFQGKSGPMGQAPRECGVRPGRVTRVAFHPRALVVALGYDDGWLLLCRLTDGAEILVRGPRLGEGGGSISALAWDADGRRVVFGTDGGEAGLLTLPA